MQRPLSEFPLTGRDALFNIRPSLGATASNERLMWGYLSPCFNGGQHQGAVPLVAFISSLCPTQLPSLPLSSRNSPQQSLCLRGTEFPVSWETKTKNWLIYTSHPSHEVYVSCSLLRDRKTRHTKAKRLAQGLPPVNGGALICSQDLL